MYPRDLEFITLRPERNGSGMFSRSERNGSEHNPDEKFPARESSLFDTMTTIPRVRPYKSSLKAPTSKLASTQVSKPGFAVYLRKRRLTRYYYSDRQSSALKTLRWIIRRDFEYRIFKATELLLLAAICWRRKLSSQELKIIEVYTRLTVEDTYGIRANPKIVTFPERARTQGETPSMRVCSCCNGNCDSSGAGSVRVRLTNLVDPIQIEFRPRIKTKELPTAVRRIRKIPFICLPDKNRSVFKSNLTGTKAEEEFREEFCRRINFSSDIGARSFSRCLGITVRQLHLRRKMVAEGKESRIHKIVPDLSQLNRMLRCFVEMGIPVSKSLLYDVIAKLKRGPLRPWKIARLR